MSTNVPLILFQPVVNNPDGRTVALEVDETVGWTRDLVTAINELAVVEFVEVQGWLLLVTKVSKEAWENVRLRIANTICAHMEWDSNETSVVDMGVQ